MTALESTMMLKTSEAIKLMKAVERAWSKKDG